jgi:hypothetical protein
MTAANDIPAPTPPRAPSAAPLWAARWRWLALLATVLIFYAAWAPWSGDVDPLIMLTGPSGPLASLSPRLWAALTVSGLLVVPWLWSRHFRAVAALAFALWLLLQTLTLGLVAAVQLRALLAHTSTQLDLGAFLGPLALVAGWVATIPLLRAALRQRRTQGWLPLGAGGPRGTLPAGAPAAGRARAGLVYGGASTLTAGLIIWTVAFQFMPWAVYPCATNNFIGGACLGISSGEGLFTAGFFVLPSGPPFLDPLTLQFTAPILLLAGAVLLLYAVWRLPVTGRLCAWAAVWLALATATVLLTAAGIATIIANGPTVSVGTPSPYPAGLLAAVGLALGWLALIPLLLGSLASRRQG